MKATRKVEKREHNYDGPKTGGKVDPKTGHVVASHVSAKDVSKFIAADPGVPGKGVAAAHASRRLPVPDSLLNSVPCSRATFELLLALSYSTMPRLDAEMESARAKGAVATARAYVVLYKLAESLEEFRKQFSELFERYKKDVVPAALDAEGVTSIPLDEGMRVGTQSRTFASIRPDSKDLAYDWLRQNYPDLLVPTVNSSSLSSLAKQLMEEENRELPETLFNVALVPTTSVTVARGKK